MIRFIRGWLASIQTQYVNPLEQRRALGLTLMNGGGVVAALIRLLVLAGMPPNGEASDFNSVLPFLVAPFLAAAVQRFVSIGRLRLASWIFVGMTIAAAVLLRLGGLSGTASVVLLIPVIVAGLLLNRREMAAAMGLLLLGVLFAAFNQSRLTEPVVRIAAQDLSQDLGFVLLVLVMGIMALALFNGLPEHLAESVLKNRRQMDLLKNAHLSSGSDVDALLVRMADLLVDKMLYTSAQVYLLDDEDHLNVYTRTGMGTRHSVNLAVLANENAIYQAVRQGKRVLVTARDTFEARSHLLPSTNYALALPLVMENRVIGVLDIQSNQPANPFDDDETALLDLLVSELAHALVQSRERRGLQQALEVRESASERLEAQLVELRQQVERGQGTDWTAYLRGRRQLAFGFDMTNPTLSLTPANDLPEYLKPAMLRGEILVETRTREQVVNIPIKRYDDVLGAMSFSLPLDRPVTDRQLEMATAVTNRLASALENARLVEQTRTQAERERKAGEISDLLLGQQEVRTLLDAAAQSFNEALGAVYTRIYLEPEALVNRSEEAL
ncbi:MAG: GAF domain-containing protein [Anaerolineae bacterium]|nr:GAF domain-containing protein [Anaerolineae bacterium]